MFDKKPSKPDANSLAWWEEVSKKACAKDSPKKEPKRFLLDEPTLSELSDGSRVEEQLKTTEIREDSL